MLEIPDSGRFGLFINYQCLETFMKNFLIVVLLLLIPSISVFSQLSLDSLERKLPEITNDSLRHRALTQLAEGFQYTNFKKAESFIEQALALAETRQWDWALAQTYKRIGFLATITGDYARAIRYDNMNLELATKNNDSTAISESLNFIGNDYSDLGQYDQAYYFFSQSYRIGRLINDSIRITIALHNLGGVFRQLEQHELALNYFDLSKKISEKINDLDGIPYSLEAIGTVYARKKEFSKAKDAYDRALKLIRERKITVIEPRVLTRLGELSADQNDYTQALAYFDSASLLHTNTANEFGLAEVDYGKAMVFIAQKKYAEATALINSSMSTARSLNAVKLYMECLQTLGQVEELKKNYAGALSFFKQHKVMRDSLFNSGMMEKVYREQVRYATENKDEQIAELSKVKEQREKELSEQKELVQRQSFVRNILVVVMALTGILLFTVYRSGQRRIRINKLLIEHQEEIKKRSFELEQLNKVKDKFFSIISHDLRSPINALSSILDLVDRKQITTEEFTKVAHELRLRVNNTKTLINNLLDWALLQMDNLKIQMERIDLHAIVQENITTVSSLQLKEVSVENRIDAKTYALGDPNMINLVFRNLIMNGMKFTEAGGRIVVESKDEGNYYRISVTDNGVGIAPEIQKILFDKTAGYSTRGTANEKGTGLGLILCKEFIERNGGKIWMESEPGKGSTFYFTLRKA
jgi:signal transduction histidine kinase